MSSSTTRAPAPASSSTTAQQPAEHSFFGQQRGVLLREIGVSFEHVLANINKLNRAMEGVIAVGNEFSSVEALWSQFENVMAKDPDAEAEGQHTEEGDEHGDEETEIHEDMDGVDEERDEGGHGVWNHDTREARARNEDVYG